MFPFLILTCLMQILCFSYACLNSLDTSEVRPTVSATQAAADTNQIKKMMGNNLDVHDYNPQGYDDKKGGPVSGKDDLNCDFDSPCCWDNEPIPFDQFDWKSVEGQTDNELMKKNFLGVKPPNGKFLATSKSTAVRGSDEAHFVACALQCTKEDIKVTLKHWRSPGTILQVCQKDSFAAEKPPTSCQTVTAPDPGPSTLTLPNGQLIDIVVIAKSFIDPFGAVVAIDDIKVEYIPCKSSKSNGGASPLCKTIPCDFEGKNSCGYTTVKSENSAGRSSEFKVKEGRSGNRETGVPGPADGSGYLSSEVAPGTTAIVQSAEISGTESKQLLMKFYEAVDDFVLQVCKNDLNTCENISNPQISVDDRSWKEAIVKIPPDTKKVFIVAKNTGTNKGAVGIDTIQLIDERTGESLC